MQISKVVVNASPLIILLKAGQADLLPKLFENIVVPQAVIDEITLAKSDLVSVQLKKITWYTTANVPINPLIANWNLGDGESSVLSFALAHPEYRAIIDDAAARRCANALAIPTLGTGGTLVLAKRRSLIPSVEEKLRLLKNAGLWLSNQVIDLIKQEAGE